jgi:hypothetical protein
VGVEAPASSVRGGTVGAGVTRSTDPVRTPPAVVTRTSASASPVDSKRTSYWFSRSVPTSSTVRMSPRRSPAWARPPVAVAVSTSVPTGWAPTAAWT